MTKPTKFKEGDLVKVLVIVDKDLFSGIIHKVLWNGYNWVAAVYILSLGNGEGTSSYTNTNYKNKIKYFHISRIRKYND